MDPSATPETTFLFTDIEGSTELWEKEPGRMAQAVACHDALLRESIETCRGRVVKTTGDGVYAAFADPRDAVEAALAVQQSLADPGATAGLALKVRCGMHAGEAQARDNDYFGGTINRAARVMALAYGGQVLVSRVVAERLRGREPEGLSLLDLGEARLKGLAEPERVFQLVHPSLRREFPALRSLEATPNNLPQTLTSFVGREREIDEATALLESARLVTLLGMGGLGKTRLSLEIARAALDRFRDGAWFVDLAPIRDPSLVVAEAAQSLGVREEPGTPLESTLFAHLRSRRLLLILDNCEHVVGAAAAFADAALRAAPEVRILATSREALRVPGEQTYPVLPLPVPGHADDVEALAESAAVQLFVDRARQHRPSFALTQNEAPGVAELVARLEGIPLAIELAAARVRALSIAEINVRLKDRYRLLTGGGRVLLARQQTLRALVDWSHDLLPDPERTLLARLAVFVGGFDLDAAEAVCGTGPLDPADVLDLVASLAEKSLLNVEESDLGSRYRMLETIRDYAREKLDAGGERDAIAARHCKHFLDVAKAIKAGLQGAERAEWARRADTEQDNLRAGIAAALAGTVDPVVAVKYAVALQAYWLTSGSATEGRNLVRAMLSLPAVRDAPVAHAHALYVGAALAHVQGDNADAADALERCLALRRSLADAVSPNEIAGTLSTLSRVRLQVGDVAGARAREEEAIAVFRRIGNRLGEAIGLVHLAEVAMVEGDRAQARERLAEGLARAREIGHPELLCECERGLGEIALEEADLAGACASFERALRVARDGGDRRGEALSLGLLGRCDLAAGDVASALQRLQGALRAFRARDMHAEVLACLEDHARLALALGRTADAAALAAAATRHRERMTLPRTPWAEARWQREFAAARAALGDRGLEAAWSEGLALEVDAAVARALALAPAEAGALAA